MQGGRSIWKEATLSPHPLHWSVVVRFDKSLWFGNSRKDLVSRDCVFLTDENYPRDAIGACRGRVYLGKKEHQKENLESSFFPRRSHSIHSLLSLFSMGRSSHTCTRSWTRSRWSRWQQTNIQALLPMRLDGVLSPRSFVCYFVCRAWLQND